MPPEAPALPSLWTSGPGPRHRFVSIAAAAAGLLALAACSGEAPAGQVAARVNGVEITIAELNEEARARDLTLEKNPALRSALIQEMVDRKLLVAEAKAQELHRTPRHILAERRMGEILLVQQLLAGEESSELSPERLRVFMAANPHAFAQRVTARADLLSFSGQPPPSLRQELTSAKNPGEIEAKLGAAGVSFHRSQEVWDSADPASPLWGGQIAASKGTLVLLPRGGGTIAAILSEVTPQPIPADQQVAVARALVSRSVAEQRMRKLLEQARAGATISYQPGFDPGRGAPHGQR
jgi:hypothetical protein